MVLSQKKKKICFPADIVPVLNAILEREEPIDQDKEHFWCIGLNASNCIQYIELVSLGIINRCLVHPREVFRFAIMKGVQAIIVAHNHPGGNVEPSQDDHAVTRNLKEAGQVVGIKVLDHIIIGDGYFSMLEKGQL